MFSLASRCACGFANRGRRPQHWSAGVEKTKRVIAPGRGRLPETWNTDEVDPSITLDGTLRGCIACGVVGIKPNGKVAFLSSTAADLLGMQPPLPTSLQALPPALRDLILQAQRELGSPSPKAIQIQLEGAGDPMLSVETSPISFQDGEQGLLVTVSGLHEGTPNESKLRHFERLARLGVLSAGLAHELRNSMVALSTMTDLLLEQHQDNELALTVRRELDRANQLAVRMLRYARPNTQTKKATSTHEILDRALHLATSRFKEAGTTITRSLRADPDLVAADEAHLEQMFLNLLLNAADAVHPSGQVTLTTDLVDEPKLGRAVRIAVRDTGVGIAPEALPKLFQPFFTTKRHGTGLGLYLAQRIIDEHSGTIQVDSAPGEGTCVCVHLPAHSA